MKRKIVIAALAVVTLGACGPMDEQEAAELTGVFGSALYAPGTVMSTQDPEPIKGNQGTWTYIAIDPVSGLASPQRVMMPGSTVSSTQDPEPVKGRPATHEVLGGVEDTATTTEQPDSGGSEVSSTQDPEPIKPLWWLLTVATGGNGHAD